MNNTQWEKRSERVLEAVSFSSLIPNLFAGFTTKQGGTSKFPYSSLNLGFHVGDEQQDVQQNRHLVAKDIGFPLDQWIGSEQIHSSTIVEVTRGDAGRGAANLDTAIKQSDGLYTNEKGILLTSLYADCVPLYFVAKNAQYIALCHAGWQGTVKQIGPKLVGLWIRNYQIELSDIHVLIGPSISQQHYEVNEPVIEQVDRVLPAREEKPYESTRPGHYLLDLPKLNQLLLLKVGLKAEQIHMSDMCTFEEDAFFSHRQAQGMTGRMMSAIGFKKG
ncbi:peptidoglycan editing factor PgeF [Shouchella patagoniensis]|uniref:peptidoglycan editing factor PgeF n=1 Tax=Shouchella patagoniensis TaxID=228576 RepID=UPI000995A411|nr:peptidoglycan editing factor PgeF [Shouchella patagoniensis]